MSRNGEMQVRFSLQGGLGGGSKGFSMWSISCQTENFTRWTDSPRSRFEVNTR